MKKKILFLTPTLFHGGAERVISELSLHFPSEAELVLVVFEKKLSFPFNGRVVSLNIPLSLFLPLNSLLLFFRVWRFKKIVAKEAPDAVISAGASANIVSLLACPKLSVARVDNFVSVSRKGLRGLFFRVALRKLFPRAKSVIAVSQAIKDDLVATYNLSPQLVKVIPNPVDTEKIVQRAKEPLLPEHQQIFTDNTVITMGRLVPQKASLSLVRAFSTAQKEIPDAQLVFLGEGPLREQVEKEIERLGIGKNVHLLGWQENPFQFLAQAKLFALSSLWEGLPDVLLEALAVGLPIVSTDCRSGPREILAPTTAIANQTTGIEKAEYGVLVQMDREDLLAKAMSDLLKDPTQLAIFSAKARQRALAFDIKNHLAHWDFLWENTSP
tara:strand:- start:28 stop:1179 length:1152 start_codon:yes stop_codon:yes gene_type:complete